MEKLSPTLQRRGRYLYDYPANQYTTFRRNASTAGEDTCSMCVSFCTEYIVLCLSYPLVIVCLWLLSLRTAISSPAGDPIVPAVTGQFPCLTANSYMIWQIPKARQRHILSGLAPPTVAVCQVEWVSWCSLQPQLQEHTKYKTHQQGIQPLEFRILP